MKQLFKTFVINIGNIELKVVAKNHVYQEWL